MSLLRKLKNIFLNAILPSFCYHCRQHITSGEIGLCGDCFNSVIVNDNLFCAVCKARLPTYEKTCHRGVSYLLAAATNYDQPAIKNLIWGIKYHRQKPAAIQATKIINRYLKNIGLANALREKTIIVPIPLHAQREKERGFNQSQEMAQRLIADYPLMPALLRKINNKPQAEIANSQERHKNITGAFVINPPYQNAVAKMNIILIDDVHTSGATISEAAKVLKENGAKKIIALVLAKA